MENDFTQLNYKAIDRFRIDDQSVYELFQYEKLKWLEIVSLIKLHLQHLWHSLICSGRMNQSYEWALKQELSLNVNCIA